MNVTILLEFTNLHPQPLSSPHPKACNLRRQCQPASLGPDVLTLLSHSPPVSRSPELHVVAAYWCGRTITGFRITLDQQNASASGCM